ncbi:MAG: DUF917 domain-containing protein [bacterium]|nr:DUF917 domain-containing protein [bacterium]
MKLILPNQWTEIISGANLLATGGGGTIKASLPIIKKIRQPTRLVSLSELKPDDLICTVFGVGGKQNCDSVVASRNAFAIFQQILKQPVAAMIPVEAGPMAFANTAFIADKLKIPLLDSDIVGMRSSPEVFLETITIPGLKRTPCVVADDKGKYLIIRSSKNPEELEKKLRDFAISVGGDAFVAGYPLKVEMVKGIVPENSITLSMQTGKTLQKLQIGKTDLNRFCKATGWSLLGRGEIIEVKKGPSKGFSEGKYVIRPIENNANSAVVILGSLGASRTTPESDSGQVRMTDSAKLVNNLTIIFKNENLVFLRNGKVVLTCPDSISLLDLGTFEAINNFESNNGKRVAILGRKSIPIWRTRKGKKLFSPKKIGLDFKQKLLI